jgi:hypothetical protein
VVLALDPVEAMQLSGNASVRPIAQEVKERLERVLRALEGEGAAD